METLYEYLLENYKPNEPIFLAELQIEGMSRVKTEPPFSLKKLSISVPPPKKDIRNGV